MTSTSTMTNDWIERFIARLDRDLQGLPRWSLVHSSRPAELTAAPREEATAKCNCNDNEMRIVNVKYDTPDLYVGRDMPNRQGCGLGNPFRLDKRHPLGTTLADYVLWLVDNPQVIEKARRLTKGCKTVGCWCAPPGGVDIDGPLYCHAQILMRAVRGDYDKYIQTRTRPL